MQGTAMENMNVADGAYDFAAAHAAMRRYVDGDILPASPLRCWSAGI